MDNNQTIDPPPPAHLELYSIERTRGVLGDVSERWVYQLTYDGELTMVKVGRRSMILASSVDAYIERNVVDKAS